jgi:hypothetical protein
MAHATNPLRALRHPLQSMRYDTYRPGAVPPARFAEQVRQAQGWRNRLPTGLGILGAGLGAMEARKPAGTSNVDMIPFTPDASPAAQLRGQALQAMPGGIGENYGHYFGENMQSLKPTPEFSQNYQHYMGENLQGLRDAAKGVVQ